MELTSAALYQGQSKEIPHILKSTLRHLLRHPGYTSTNILGLGVGIALGLVTLTEAGVTEIP